MVKTALDSGQKLINEGNAIISFAKGLIINKYKLTEQDELNLDTGEIKTKEDVTAKKQLSLAVPDSEC